MNFTHNIDIYCKLIILHESPVTGYTLSFLGSTADSNTQGEEKTGSYEARGGEAVLNICSTVGTLGPGYSTRSVLTSTAISTYPITLL